MPRTFPAPRRAAVVALITVAALALGGCLSIKAQTAFQRAPGVVSLGGIVCASDYIQPERDDCNQTNVAETDQDRVDAASAGLGQLLVGFRVPDGTGAPASFLSDGQDVSFARDAGYTQILTTRFPPGAGEHWEGYLSTVKSFDPDVTSDAKTAFHPEFTLPSPADGTPFTGPLPWRMVVGFRTLDSAGQASEPITCTAVLDPKPTLCADSPRSNRIPIDLLAPVSDFGVLAGSDTTAPQTTTARVSFPIRYLDGANLGAQDASVTATTDLPGSSATPAAPTVRLAPGATTTVEVSVPVPLGTQPGTYQVKLSAAVGSPSVARSRTATIEVVGPPDGDRDTIADPFDRCPTVARGSFDADADGCVGPYARIAASTSGTWSVDAKGVRIGTMRLKGVPAGARVALRGAARQTLTARASVVDFKRLRGKLLKRGKGFNATVTRTGFVGQRLTLEVKRFGKSKRELKRIARRPFKTTRRCIPVGASAPAARCPVTPPTGP
jgi:hypothetical protein